MLVVPVKEGENIERALKKYKKKFEKTGTNNKSDVIPIVIPIIIKTKLFL